MPKHIDNPKAKQERLALEAKAKEAADKGNLEDAIDLTKEAENTKPVAIAAPPKMGGSYTVRVFNVEVSDQAAFMKWAAENAPEYLLIDLPMLKKEATFTKGARKWPGITVTESKSSRMRG